MNIHSFAKNEDVAPQIKGTNIYSFTKKDSKYLDEKQLFAK